MMVETTGDALQHDWVVNSHFSERLLFGIWQYSVAWAISRGIQKRIR